ncbi:thioredoxin family protein [uncultured Phycicoccus sp.]|uniref:thioredoxin family protein n=1 Tax=uncultured Phycicoccus sp. TaxID=661422 RepID=UPI00261F4C8D|nr:thioredoxin family protein [uncultured Phycicoccus sp.]
MRTRPMALAVASLAAALTLAACGTGTATSDPTPAASDGPSAGVSTSSPAESSSAESSAGATAESSAPADGAYVTRAEYEADPAAYEGSKVVYFFHASWCSSCRATEKAIAETGVPAGLTLVKADYDSDTELRQRYGVTTQHTFVQVGPDGERLGIWTGSPDGAAILAETV